MTKEEILNRIIAVIEMWDETQLKMSWASDGGGHRDFMGLKVTEYGRAELMMVIDAAMPVRSIANAGRDFPYED